MNAMDALNKLVETIRIDPTVRTLLDEQKTDHTCFWELNTKPASNISDFYFNRHDAQIIQTNITITEDVQKNVQYQQHEDTDKNPFKNKYEQRSVMGPALHTIYEGLIKPYNAIKLFETKIKDVQCVSSSNIPKYMCPDTLILTPARKADIARLFIPGLYVQEFVENGKIIDIYLQSILGISDEEAVEAHKIFNWDRFKNINGEKTWKIATEVIPSYKQPAFTYLHYISNIIAQKAFIETMNTELVFPPLDTADNFTIGVDRIYLYKGSFYLFLQNGKIQGSTSLNYLLMKAGQKKLEQSI